jgi:hypothetical protein
VPKSSPSAATVPPAPRDHVDGCVAGSRYENITPSSPG